MTEAEAMTRWCPFSRTARYEGTPINRNVGEGYAKHTLCLASDCMAWRWQSKPFANVQPGETGPAAGSGYCGLAGAPQ